MADATHMYVVIRGGYTFTTDETWQTGFRCLLVADPGTPDNVGTLPTFSVDDVDVHRTETDWTILADWKAGLGAGSNIAIDDWLNDQIGNEIRNVLMPYCNNKVQVREIHAWPIDAAGVVVGGHSAVLAYTGSLPGGSHSGNPLPLENSVVVSLQTGRIGRHGRGRMYWPVQSTSDVTATATFDHTARDQLAADFATFFHDIALTGGLGHDEWLLPIVSGKPYTKYAVVTGVRVGDVVDTQRRRRRQQTEAYQHEDVSY